MIINPTDPNELIKEITQKLNADTVSMQEVIFLCSNLVKSIFRPDRAPDVKKAEHLLSELRSRRQFAAMQSIADALIQMGCNTFRIRKLYAQSLLDLGNITAAICVLNQLKEDTKASDLREAPGEYREATGLKGRAYKQLYICSGKPSFMIMAIDAYAEVYHKDPENNLWHGINVVALLQRAKKDNIDISAYADPQKVAKNILDIIDDKYENQDIGLWDFTTAAEACIALKEPEEALKWFSGYTRMPSVNAFALSSTIRQLEEVWELSMDTEMGKLILPVLRAELLKREGGNVVMHIDELLQQKKAEAKNTEIYKSLADEDINDGRSLSPDLERVFGDDSFKTYKWYMKGADQCLSVARIGRDASKGHGTGFLLKGNLLHDSLGEELVVVTNAHVVSKDPKENALRPEEAVIIFEALDRDTEFRILDLIFTSSSRELDVSIIRFDAADQARLKELTRDVSIYKIASFLPHLNVGDKQLQRIYIIGHPGGGTLQLSFQDNTLLDYEAPKIHYRTPTEGGSSGSPVFNESWELIGLHHAGSKTLPKLNGKQGTYEANEGIWISNIKQALSAVL